jgi:hypothetical protein
MIDEQGLYKELKANNGESKYDESYHCPLLFATIGYSARVTTFMKAAKISQRTLIKWCHKHPIFAECYSLAQIIAQENWELDYLENANSEGFDLKAWKMKGRHFEKTPIKMKLNINGDDNPWEQYKSIITQASMGDLTAQDVKLLMEAVSAGTKVFESFKLQGEVDKMREDLNQMSQRNGRATAGANLKIAATNPNPV